LLIAPRPVYIFCHTIGKTISIVIIVGTLIAPIKIAIRIIKEATGVALIIVIIGERRA
jgi:hypothetical protein